MIQFHQTLEGIPTMPKKKWKEGETVTMHCYGCEKSTTFTVEEPEEGPVCECGHWQESEAQGAMELCEMATWHDMNAYNQTADKARSGGYNPPAKPPFVAKEEGKPCPC